MTAIRDVFPLLGTLCVLCLQFDSVQVQSAETKRLRLIDLPRLEKPNASSTVEAPELAKNWQSNNTVALNTTMKWIKERRRSASNNTREHLLNQHKVSNITVKLKTTKELIGERRESAGRRNKEKLLKQHKESNFTVILNATKKEIKESSESARNRNKEKLRNQHKEPNPKAGPSTGIKEIEERRESAMKKKNEKQRNQLNIETIQPWPKARNKSERHQQSDWIPVYMRQEVRRTDEKKEENQEKKDDDVYDEIPRPDYLNIYSLREDMMTMLSSIPNINATVAVIGRTAEYNDIVLCKISENYHVKQNKLRKLRFKADDDKYIEEDTEKKIVFIVHGLSTMAFTEVPCLSQKLQFKKLLNIYTKHLDKFDIYFIPIANPDGVADPAEMELNNKNKSPQTACSGVALDRNFDVSWNAFHVNSCHQQYPGPSPFSEPEARAVGEILHQFNHRIVAYINVHAGVYSAEVFKGDAVLYPKGFVEFNSDDDKYMDMKGEIDEAMRTAGFKVMSVTVDTLYNWYGKVTGTSVDYASTVYGIPFAVEFVMQPYADKPFAADSEKTTDKVLTEVWKRVIDVVFTNIHRNQQNNELLK